MADSTVVVVGELAHEAGEVELADDHVPIVGPTVARAAWRDGHGSAGVAAATTGAGATRRAWPTAGVAATAAAPTAALGGAVPCPSTGRNASMRNSVISTPLRGSGD